MLLDEHGQPIPIEPKPMATPPHPVPITDQQTFVPVNASTAPQINQPLLPLPVQQPPSMIPPNTQPPPFTQQPLNPLGPQSVQSAPPACKFTAIVFIIQEYQLHILLTFSLSVCLQGKDMGGTQTKHLQCPPPLFSSSSRLLILLHHLRANILQ
jgi:hypothetical protein